MAITTGTGTNAGDVSFQGTVEADTAGQETLTIDSGAGDVTFSKKIGITKALGGLNVNATAGDGAGIITFTEDIGDTSAGVKGITAVGNSSTAQIVFSEDTYTFDTGATTFTVTSSGDIDLNKLATTTFTTANTSITFAGGDIDLGNGSDLVVNSVGGAISIAGISGHSDEIVTLNANDAAAEAGADGETVSLGNVGDSGHTQIHNLTVSADDGITLTGAIYTSAGGDASAADIVFNDKVLIGGTVIIDSDDSANDGAITFTTSIDGADGTDDDLTIDGGTGTGNWSQHCFE